MTREHFYLLSCNSGWPGRYAKKEKSKGWKKVGVFALLCSCYANTTSSVYPAGSIRDNPSLEDPNRFQYYSMKPFTAHIIKLQLLMSQKSWFSMQHFSSNCVMTTKHNCNQSCRFICSHEWMWLESYQLWIS